MCKKLDRDEWLTKTPPIFWLKTDYLKGKPQVFVDLIDKWCCDNLAGEWFFRDGDIFCFSTVEDRATLKMFILTGVFENDYGEI
jgi:hypothetical protein